MRFVVCADPDGDEAVDGATAHGLTTALEDQGHECRVASDPVHLPELDEDDWMHVTGGLALQGSGSSRVLQVVGACPGAVSVDLFLSTGEEDALAYWEVLDPLLQLVGLAGGVLFTRAQDVAALCGDPDHDPVTVAQTWAEAYGLALCVVVDVAQATAVKADGRTTRVPRRSTALGPEVRGRLVGAFLAAYASNPANLEGALQEA